MLRSHIFRKVTIVGVGLMGGSVGMAIKKNQLAAEVVGLSQRQSTLMTAIKNFAIDEGTTDLAKAIRNADLVILATPVETIIKILPTLTPHLKRGCIVTDMGSTKIEIVETAEKVLNNQGFFVGSHPMAGSEKSGVEFAKAELFEQSLCFMTPTSKTNQVAKEKLKYFWTKLGAHVKFLTPAEHDDVVANISHLPHLLAFALMETISQPYLEYASSGLKDATRLAASSPQMWSDICLSNPKNIVKSLDELVKRLSFLRKAINTGDQKGLIEHFSKARDKRNALQPPTQP